METRMKMSTDMPRARIYFVPRYSNFRVEVCKWARSSQGPIWETCCYESELGPFDTLNLSYTFETRAEAEAWCAKKGLVLSEST